jgi:Dolichyl-phosphate-mannose-protein mannosyltransferase
VAAFQHLLGLGVACLLYALLRRHSIWRWVAALASAPVLLDGYQLQAEQTIMPDVTFEALVLSGLAALLWRREPAAWQLALGGALFGIAVDVRQVGGVLIVPALAFILVRATVWRARLLAGVLVTAAFAMPVLAYMTIQLEVHGQFAITVKSSYIFYGRAATAANCSTLRLPADERTLCPSQRQIDTLGIDGLVGAPEGPLLSYRPPPGETIQAMADRFDFAVLTQQPAAISRRHRHEPGQAVRTHPGSVPRRYADHALAVPDQLSDLPAADHVALCRRGATWRQSAPSEQDTCDRTPVLPTARRVHPGTRIRASRNRRLDRNLRPGWLPA